MSLAIEVEHLSKCYRLYQRPVDRLLEIFSRRPRHRPFWALRDISFNVASGETFGIIGDNGAGKSTLLKILAGTLKPTTGRFLCQGRVAALLELGAGFHPELTGRQNFYLNATLLGLTEEEIKAKEEEIISFSELGTFIDQPVKTYSSGMYVRLAFSIAVQVNPDILIVDEALSVGDQRFQRKSIDRIIDFCRKGKTIVFCSHSMYHVLNLCQRVLWLDRGQVRLLGPAKEVVKAYEDWSREREKENKTETEKPSAPSNPYRLQILSPSEINIKTFDTLEIEGIYEGLPEDQELCLGFDLSRNDEVSVFATSTAYQKVKVSGPKGRFRLVFPRFPLLAGSYRLAVVLADPSCNAFLAISSVKILVERVPLLFGTTYLEHKWEISSA